MHVFVARRPPLYWSLVALLAAAPAVVICLQFAEARRARDGWLERRSILVTRDEVGVGDVLDAGDVEARAWPVGLVPDGALESLPDPAVAAAPMAAGEPVVSARLGRPALGPVGALVPPGARAVAVPRGTAPLPLTVGDTVDVVSTLDAAAASLVATGALVVHVDASTAVVAVRADELPATAAAVVTGGVTLALSGGANAGP
jgi:Flp pilus assembly protein CpaB